MVGYDPRHKRQLSKLELAVAGAWSGMITRGICQPWDVLKIRFQLQVEPIASSSKYSGIVQAVCCIVREEGTGALWKGHIPAQLLSATFGISQFLTFEMLTKYVWHISPKLRDEQWRPTVHFLCGASAGCIATAISMPFDVIRTRLVAQGTDKLYTGIFHAAGHMYKYEGPFAFYKGLVPTLIQVGPYTGVQFAIYTFLTMAWERFSSREDRSAIGVTESIICGSVAGSSAKIAVYPLDLAKKRLQIQGFETARRSFGQFVSYHGLTHCLSKVIRDEGILGLFKGLAPSLWKAAFVSGLNFSFYEQLCEALRHLDYM